MTTKQISKLIRLAIEKYGEISLCKPELIENFVIMGDFISFWFNDCSIHSTHIVKININERL